MTHATRLACALAVALLVTGCSRPNPPSPEDRDEAVNAIRYVKDNRTGICFAMLRSQTDSGFQVFSIAAVPVEACK